MDLKRSCLTQHCASRLSATATSIRRSSSTAKSTCLCNPHFLRKVSSSAATSPRDYDAALAKLNLLASNRAITTLFEKPRQDAAATPSKTPAAASKDLNSQAIPEMLEWLRKAGYAPRDLAAMRHIHVAGTKGKGSVCAFATSLLRAAHRSEGEGGRRRHVGTYMSPHLVSPRERIAINGEPVSQHTFTEAFWQLWERFTAAAVAEGQPREMAEGPSSKPFYFRFLTILAWHIFLREGVKDVVMECGIGGEYDATNVLPPEAVSAAVVSQLGIDHVAMLGDMVEKIAWHKAGIFKPGVVGFTLGLRNEPAVMGVLRQRAAERDMQLVEVDEAAVDAWAGVPSDLRGDFQKRNQALAVLAVQEHLGIRDKAASTAEALSRLSEDMVRGLQDAKLRGRCEIIPDEKHDLEWMLDGAHTKDSIEEVAKWLAQSVSEDESVTLVFNQQERDAPKLLAHLVNTVTSLKVRDVFSQALFTRNEQVASDHNGDLLVQKALAETMKTLAPKCQTTVFDNVQDAVAEARKNASSHDKKQKVLVTGSLHLVGGIMRAIEPDSLL